MVSQREEIEAKIEQVLPAEFLDSIGAKERDFYPALIAIVESAQLQVISRIEQRLIEQHVAAKDNLKYHENNTKNTRLIGEWKGTVFGIELCLEQVRTILATKRGEIES
jgi:hypothetical protein